MLSEKNEKIRKAYDVLKVISQDEKARLLYEAREAEIRDQLTRIHSAREEGKIEGKIEDAINFLKLGVNESIVAEGTGLSVEKVRELKRNLN